MVRIIKRKMDVNLARAQAVAEDRIEEINARLAQLQQQAAELQRERQRVESQADAIVEGARLGVPEKRVQETLIPNDLEGDEDKTVQVAFVVSLPGEEPNTEN